MNRAMLTRRVTAAEAALACAESELNSALESLWPTLSGDKVMVTNVIMQAFERVKASRRDVAKLKQCLSAEPSE